MSNGTKSDYRMVCGSMTAAGIAGMMVCKSVLKNLPPATKKGMDESIYDGVAWICRNYSVEKTPPFQTPDRHYYYLFALERTGIMGHIDAFDNHYWYRDGAKLLCDAQNSDGYWDSQFEVHPRAIIDTSSALLFLKRGAVPVGPIFTER
jgi:hypothetical protein